MTASGDIGVIGLAVMGANLALNLADAGHHVVAFNRTRSVTEEFMSGEAATRPVNPAFDLAELVSHLKTPRKILLMVKAGDPIDAVISELTPLLSPGDIIIDGGNSLYTDTARRYEQLSEKGLRFLGVGISGGEEGARYGPSLMPGGDPGAWGEVADILRSIAAIAPDGTPCCEWVGPGGAGHFVKMVHNGIEYGDMQVIAEAYDLMNRGLGMPTGDIAEVFAEWNRGRLKSYLIEITSRILQATEEGVPMVDLILDAAGQKGTGAWTVTSSMEQSEPTTLVAEAVYARIVSSRPDARSRHASAFPNPVMPLIGVSVGDIESALYASKIVSYAQGFRLLTSASTEYQWEVDLGSVASLWRAGCIIRAAFLEDITEVYRNDRTLSDLTLSPFFSEALTSTEDSWRRVVSGAIASGVPAPAYSSALAYFDGMRSERLPANLIQAQRDYFGAHTFERVDRARGEWFHHDWLSP